MTYIVRFNDREGEHTHLVYASPNYRVAHHAGGGKRICYTAEEATTFPSEAAAYEALGRFIAERGTLTDKCWISEPAVVEYSPPVVLATSRISGIEVTLTRRGEAYFVARPGGTHARMHRGNAITFYLQSLKELL